MDFVRRIVLSAAGLLLPALSSGAAAETLTVATVENGDMVRMQALLLGDAAFRKGSDLYFDRHDGQAVTIEDFSAAMETAGDCDLAGFRRWYVQAGTPQVTVTSEYSADDGELTRTQKVRRKFINERYQPLIDALYSDKDSQFVSTTVVFEDGRQGTIEADVRLRSVGTPESLARAS